MIYKLLKINARLQNHRIKFLALYLFHQFRFRYLSVNLDPVLACNLRCTMCYFSDKEYIKKLKGILKFSEAEIMAKAIFKRALKLQIGCGTEPTLYKNLPELVSLAKSYKIPYISLTTNGNLLNSTSIENLLKAGLNEFTISVHGVEKSTYEVFMKGAKHETFLEIFNILKDLKKHYPFKIRVNYTFNKDNFDELYNFFDVYDANAIDILQIRPIKKLGDTAYNNFDLTGLVEQYPNLHAILHQKCKNHNIVFMAPKNLHNSISNSKSKSAVIHNYTYCYASPNFLFRPDFDWKKETFEEYTNRISWSGELLRNIFKSSEAINSVAYKLDYDLS